MTTEHELSGTACGPSYLASKSGPKKSVSISEAGDGSSETAEKKLIADPPLTLSTEIEPVVHHSDHQLSSRSPEDEAGLSELSISVEDLVDCVTCSICVDIVHDAVSPGPCLHVFCGGCLSRWIFGSDKPNIRCPECRTPMKTITHNHSARKLAAIVESQSKSYKRSDEEKEDLDGKNRFRNRRIHNLQIEIGPVHGRRQWRQRRRRDQRPY